MANAIKNFVRTGSIIGNDGSGTIEKTTGRGNTFCTKCHRVTGSKNLTCRHCGDVRTPRSEIPRFTYNPRSSRKSTKSAQTSKTVNPAVASLLLKIEKLQIKLAEQKIKTAIEREGRLAEKARVAGMKKTVASL